MICFFVYFWMHSFSYCGNPPRVEWILELAQHHPVRKWKSWDVNPDLSDTFRYNPETLTCIPPSGIRCRKGPRLSLSILDQNKEVCFPGPCQDKDNPWRTSFPIIVYMHLSTQQNYSLSTSYASNTVRGALGTWCWTRRGPCSSCTQGLVGSYAWTTAVWYAGCCKREVVLWTERRLVLFPV